jgi:hypothetical protein
VTPARLPATALDDAAAARDELQHDLISPPAMISGRAQLLARMLQRSSSLTEAERSTLLSGLSTIEAAVRSLVTRIDSYGHEDADAPIRHAVIVAPEPVDPVP